MHSAPQHHTGRSAPSASLARLAEAAATAAHPHAQPAPPILVQPAAPHAPLRRGRGADSLARLAAMTRAEDARPDALAHGHGFASALILAPREELAAVDRTALRLAGTRNVTVMTSGVSAARRLARMRGMHGMRRPLAPTFAQDDPTRPAVDVVICHEQLADMTALDFLRLVRTHPRLLDLPVLVVSSAATREAVLAAIGSGCSGFLGRPYTVATLDGQLRRARRALTTGVALAVADGIRLLSDEEFDLALEHFSSAAADADNEAEIHFLEGTAHLLREQWDAAITAFNHTLRCNALHADACLGLADAWRGKGDMDKSHAFRRRAGEIYARARQWRRAQKVFADLLAEAPAGTPNPLLAEAARLLREGRIDDAAAALLAGRELTPGAPLHEHVARACQFTDAPERTAAAMCRALSGTDPEFGTQLHRRMLGRFGTPSLDVDSHGEPVGLLDRLLGGTVLHDVLTVARHTLKVWRQAGI